MNRSIRSRTYLEVIAMIEARIRKHDAAAGPVEKGTDVPLEISHRQSECDDILAELRQRMNPREWLDGEHQERAQRKAERRKHRQAEEDARVERRAEALVRQMAVAVEDEPQPAKPTARR